LIICASYRIPGCGQSYGDPRTCCGDCDEPDLPESIRRATEDLARQDGVSLNQFVATAVAEKVSAVQTATYFRRRAARADRASFDRVLVRLGILPPRPGDEIERD
jgi:hypothetical protein